MLTMMNFSELGIYEELMDFFSTSVILICKKTPGRPHFDKTQKEDNDDSNA